MKKASLSCLWFLLLSLPNCLSPTTACAQEYEPEIGQRGKDVIWLPTPDSQVEAMMKLAEVTPADYLIDLGSGDGRIVIAAALKGAKALGIEFNPDLVEYSRRQAEKAGASLSASFVQGDIFESDFSRATVITMYLLPDLNLRLRPKLLELKPGTRIVSHAFTMGEWEADRTTDDGFPKAYLWIIPAKVEGLWTWREGAETRTLRLAQQFQKIEGTATVRGESRPIAKAQLRGAQISFEWEKRRYSGQVETEGGMGIRGTVESPEGRREWSASRVLPAEKQ